MSLNSLQQSRDDTVLNKPNRTHRIPHIRCTANERKTIITHAENAGQSLSSYIRAVALQTPPVIAKSPASRRKRRSKAELDALDELTRQVKAVGVNLNQIARVANEQSIIAPSLPATCQQIDVVLAKLLDEVLA